MGSSAVTWFQAQGVQVTVLDGAVTKVDLLPLGRRSRKAAPPKDKFLKQALTEIRQFLAGQRRKFSVPFKQSGTAFQEAVWHALLKVPYGCVISYGDLAREAGYPQAARAVGSAMNRNQVPLIIPCHRVVASNGIGGFGCGLEWKKRLLALEKGA